MGSHILRTSCTTRIITTTRTQLLNKSTLTNPFTPSNITKITKYPIPTCLNPSKFTSLPSNIKKHSILSTGYSQINTKRLSFARSMGSVVKSEDEWRAVLSPEQFRILRQKGTEYRSTGEYDKHFEEGMYKCAGCGTPLYKSTTKFNSGCGWPAFFEGLPGAINRTPDPDGRRIEITCAACGGHLGHVFKGEGFPTPTDERHCVNSISLKFAPGNSDASL